MYRPSRHLMASCSLLRLMVQLFTCAAAMGFATSPGGTSLRDYYCPQVANPRVNLFWPIENRLFHLNATTYVAQSLGDGCYVALDAQAAYKPSGTYAATSVGIIIHDSGVVIVDATFNYFGACQIFELIDIIDPPSKTITHVALTAQHPGRRSSSAVFHSGSVKYLMSDYTYTQVTDREVSEQHVFASQVLLGFADFSTDSLGIAVATFGGIYDPSILTDSSQLPSKDGIPTPAYTLAVGGRNIDAINVGPIQTAGDTLYHDRKSNVMYMGGTMPNVGALLPIDAGIEPSAILEALSKLEAFLRHHRPIVVPGHGYPLSADEAIEFVGNFSSYVSAITGLIQQHIEEVGGDANATLQGACDAVSLSKVTELYPYFKGPAIMHALNVGNMFFATSSYDGRTGDSTGALICQLPSLGLEDDPRRLTWANIAPEQ